MIAMLEARREVRRNARDWAIEAIETWGDDAERMLREAQDGYGFAERYAFRQVRRAIRRHQRRPGTASAIGAFLKDVIVKGPTVGAAG